jgi:hypothetical protein
MRQLSQPSTSTEQSKIQHLSTPITLVRRPAETKRRDVLILPEKFLQPARNDIDESIPLHMRRTQPGISTPSSQPIIRGIPTPNLTLGKEVIRTNTDNDFQLLGITPLRHSSATSSHSSQRSRDIDDIVNTLGSITKSPAMATVRKRPAPFSPDTPGLQFISPPPPQRLNAALRDLNPRARPLPEGLVPANPLTPPKYTSSPLNRSRTPHHFHDDIRRERPRYEVKSTPAPSPIQTSTKHGHPSPDYFHLNTPRDQSLQHHDKRFDHKITPEAMRTHHPSNTPTSNKPLNSHKEKSYCSFSDKERDNSSGWDQLHNDDSTSRSGRSHHNATSVDTIILPESPSQTPHTSLKTTLDSTFNHTSTPSSLHVNAHQTTPPTSPILQQPALLPLQNNDQTTRYETFMHQEFLDQLQNQSHSTNQPSFSRTHVSETLFSDDDQHNQSAGNLSPHDNPKCDVVQHQSQHPQPLYTTSSPSGRQPSFQPDVTGISHKHDTFNDSPRGNPIILNRSPALRSHDNTQSSQASPEYVSIQHHSSPLQSSSSTQSPSQQTIIHQQTPPSMVNVSIQKDMSNDQNVSNLQPSSPIASQPVVHSPPQHQMAIDTSSDEDRPLLPRTKPKNMRKRPKPTTPSQPQPQPEPPRRSTRQHIAPDRLTYDHHFTQQSTRSSVTSSEPQPSTSAGLPNPNQPSTSQSRREPKQKKPNQ